MIGIIKNSAKEYIKVVFSIIIIFIITRLFECGYIVCVVKQQIDLNLLFTRSINFDSLFLILLSIIFLLPVLLINLINKKLAKIILNTLAFIAIFTNIILTLYFLITNTLLTHVVLDFTSNEIFNIVRNEFTFNRFFLCFTSIFIISVSIYVLTKLVERIKIFGKWNFILFGIYTIFTLIGIVNRTYTFKSIDHFDTNYQFLLGNSKHVYFIKSYLNSCSSAKIDISELEIAISKYQNTTNYFDYSDSQYPLMHTESSSNVLGSYFEKREVLPNIVLIISESLSSSFSCGAIGLKRSITSFTDSIADKGLMWSTFFSNADRSYGVLPNILASLPSGIGERGFINMKNSNSSMKYYPNHLSLVQLLKQNGYLTNYFYGGWGNFDNTGRYLKEIGIDNFIHKDNFNIHKYKKDDSKWGFNDKELFSHSFNILKSIEGKRPLSNT
jgi:phosphoglycerol transferase MdoB-like AlkP superfamily enzyme